ncbi:MAG TPA: hypothetical protein VF331_03840 [Polyangiales bacterium]
MVRAVMVIAVGLVFGACSLDRTPSRAVGRHASEAGSSGRAAGTGATAGSGALAGNGALAALGAAGSGAAGGGGTPADAGAGMAGGGAAGRASDACGGCDDGVFCNGAEHCMPGAATADARGCVAPAAS